MFESNNVDGISLPNLTDDNLKRMTVIDKFHRRTILSVIQYLFPSNTLGVRSSTRASAGLTMRTSSSEEVDECQSVEESECSFSASSSEGSMKSSTYSYESMTLSPTVSSHTEGEHVMSEVTTAASSHTEDDPSMAKRKIATSLRTKKLSIWPNSDESKLTEKDQIKCFSAKLKQFDCDIVKVSTRQPDGSFVVELADVMMVQNAVNNASEIGYALAAKKLPRPTPKQPLSFEIVSDTLQVRLGRVLTARKLCMLKKGEVVLVNKIKGRRARLVEEGSCKVIGWASLFTSGGLPLMIQRDDSSY